MRTFAALIGAILSLALTGVARAQSSSPGYKAFDVAVYARVYEVKQMADPAYLQSRWAAISRDLHVDHVYLETHRDKVVADEATIRAARRFFESRGVKVSGGITWTIDESNRFETFCYSDPAHRAWVKQVVEHTARLFDEIILDDFFFTSCKSDVEIAAKGDRSWTDYRLGLMTEAARNLVLGPAKAVNPKVRVIIKYPNWYEHFQGAGFNLETEPALFSGIYTGTETRDAVMSAQHLQPYESYEVVRYFDNIAPGRNGGGWVDPGGMKTFDRYAEQLALTLFAKAPEIALFDWRQLARPITLADRAPWQGNKTSYDFDAAVAKYRTADGGLQKDLTIATPAGWTFRMLDPVVAQLGKPVGIASYRPFHSTGEDFLHNFLGMVGLPIELKPTFPAEANTILLTEDAKFDRDIVAKIKGQLTAGKTVIVTTGLYKALEDRGIRDIAEMHVSERRALVDDFLVGGALHKSAKKVLIPQLEYLTNDSWEDAGAVDGDMGWPMLHDADYSKGHFFVLTVPDNPADLYALPQALLDRIRMTAAQDMAVRLEAPAKVAIFAYDNDTFIVESFNDQPVDVGLVTQGRFKRLRDLQSGEVLTGQTISGPPGPNRRLGWAPSDVGKSRFATALKPHSFRAFRME